MFTKKFCNYKGKRIEIFNPNKEPYTYVCRESIGGSCPLLCCYHKLQQIIFEVGVIDKPHLKKLTIDEYAVFIATHTKAYDYCKKKWYQFWK